MNDALMEVLKPVLAAIGTALAAIVTAAIVKALSKLAEKLGLQVGNEEKANIERIVREAVFSVAERAAKLLLEGVKLPPEQKLQRAFDIVKSDLPDLSDDKIKTMIHAALARYGLAADAKVRAGEAAVPFPTPPDDVLPPPSRLKVVD